MNPPAQRKTAGDCTCSAPRPAVAPPPGFRHERGAALILVLILGTVAAASAASLAEELREFSADARSRASVLCARTASRSVREAVLAGLTPDQAIGVFSGIATWGSSASAALRSDNTGRCLLEVVARCRSARRDGSWTMPEERCAPP